MEGDRGIQRFRVRIVIARLLLTCIAASVKHRGVALAEGCRAHIPLV